MNFFNGKTLPVLAILLLAIIATTFASEYTKTFTFNQLKEYSSVLRLSVHYTAIH